MTSKRRTKLRPAASSVTIRRKFHAKHLAHRGRTSRLVTNAGLLYTLAPCVLYLALAFLLTTAELSIPAVSLFLQKYMHRILEPVFPLLGMILAGLIRDPQWHGDYRRIQERADAMGIRGPLLLGILFAVSFCLTSAASFFGLLALTVDGY